MVSFLKKKPITVKLPGGLKKTVGNIETCESCGEDKHETKVYVYNDRAVHHVFVCMNPECPRCGKYSI